MASSPWCDVSASASEATAAVRSVALTARTQATRAAGRMAKLSFLPLATSRSASSMRNPYALLTY